MAPCNSVVALLLLFTLSSLASGTARDHFDAKRRLVKHLTNDSALMKEILPARDKQTPVRVNVEIDLRQITDVDEKNRAIRLTVWLRFNWNNPFLKWNREEYGGIETVRANHELFWVPDVALYNEATLNEDTHVLYKRLETKLIVDHYGDCWWNVPTTLYSQCEIDVSHFPFDKQECQITIGSWAYSSTEMNLTYSEQKADLTNFIKSAEWEIENILLHNTLQHFSHYDKKLPYTGVTLTLKIKRHRTYYIVNIILPSIIMMFLSLFSFYLHPDHGERVTLVTSAILAFTVYMLITSSFSPETSDGVPALSIYYLFVLFFMASSLFATCFTSKYPNMTLTEAKAKAKAWAKCQCCCKRPDGTVQEIPMQPSGENENTATEGSQEVYVENQSKRVDENIQHSSVGSRPDMEETANESHTEECKSRCCTKTSKNCNFTLNRFCLAVFGIFHVVCLSVFFAVVL